LFFSQYEKRRELAGILIGFGVLFLGLSVMKDSVPDIESNPDVLAFLARFAEPGYASILLFVAIGTLLTITVQSSSAAMAITLTMAFKGWITFPIAAAIVLGENIGTTVTAYLASLGMNVSARRTARAHMLFNLLGVAWILILFFPFVRGIDQLVPGAVGSPEHLPFHLSAFHTVFNILNTALLIGFVPVIARIVRAWIPDTPEDPEAGHLNFVSAQTAEDLESNLISARAELGRMATIVHDMSLWVLNAMQEDEKTIQRTKKKMYEFEALTDQINEKIGSFLTACMVSNLSEDQASRIRAKYRIAHELENIGDDCKNIMWWLARRVHKKTSFHDAGVEQLSEYSGHVLDFLRYNADYLTSGMREFSLINAREMENNLNKQRNKLRKVVRHQLTRGGDVRGEMIFMDIVRHLEQIGDSCFNISEEIMALNGETPAVVRSA
jgi:phosphate:Na+ symporter